MKEKKMGVNDFAAFASVVISSLPRDMDVVIAENWILNPNDLADVLREALMPMNKKQPDKSVHPSDTIAAKYGFTVEEDVEQPSQFEVKNLKFNPFVKKEVDGNYIASKEMRKRAVFMKGNLGLIDGENLRNQMNNSKGKFEELQSKYIVLPGTVLRDSGDRRLCVACLCWHGDSWVFFFPWLDSGWNGFGRFACSE